MSDLVIFHGGALGDLVLTLQFALRLPGVDAGSKFHLACRTNPGDLSKCRPSIERVLPEGLGLHWLYAEGDDAPSGRLRELVAGRRVLNALGSVDSVVHRRLQTLGAQAVYSFDPRSRSHLQTHITAQWRRELERQGLRFPKCIYQRRGSGTLAVPEEVRERGRALLAQHTRARRENPSANPRTDRDLCRSVPEGREIVAQGASTGMAGSPTIQSPKGATEKTPILIHPGSGGPAKCWPLRCFLDVARRLRQQGRDVCFVVGPVEVERWPRGELEPIGGEFPLIECPEPDELLSLLAATPLLIGNDAGPTHLAALIGTPTVTVFGSTSPTIWRPLGARACVIQGDAQAYPDDWGVEPRRVVESVPHP